MKIVIGIPFAGAEKWTAVWSREEESIDFHHDPERAARCTMAFAAMELKNFLSQTVDAVIDFASSSGDEDIFVQLAVKDYSSKNEAFTLEPCAGGIRITGSGRTGVLYGAYEFLRLQGWRWFAPGIEGEIAPGKRPELTLPKDKVEYSPSFDLGRGFVFEYHSQDSSDLWLWMARNRLNMSGNRPITAAFCEKLGMSSTIGGHIFEEILNPDRPLSSGKTIWEEHPEWYGVPSNGTKQKKTAQDTQFCACQESLTDFLGKEFLALLNGKWRYADRIDIWGFDTWGATCNCPKCLKLGNGSDQILFFASKLREKINQAFASNELDHKVRLVICAYEGTSSLNGPENAVPQNLLDAEDYITFYPINRCYAHDFMDNDCSWNKKYAVGLNAWLAPGHLAMPVMLGEYYNVSKFEDLPLLFSRRMSSDMLAYFKAGVRGMTYMHLPMVNWGMRTLTQLLHAQLSWDINTNIESFIEEYYSLWYGPYAEEMTEAYKLLEESWSYCSQWRAWSKESFLTQLIRWDGCTTTMDAVTGNDHLDPEAATASGKKSIKLMETALAITESALKRERLRLATEVSVELNRIRNPRELKLLELKLGVYERRLGEDRRLLYFGLDSMRLMTAIVEYYIALRDGLDSSIPQLQQEIEAVADKMDSYYIPVSFKQPGPGIVSRSALARVQLRECVRRCRVTSCSTGTAVSNAPVAVSRF